jgi:GNAT superfamily N-acetyltransferase
VRDSRIVALFDGSATVKVPVGITSPSRAAAIAHEFGYVISGIRQAHGGPGVMIFDRDDSPVARNRAAWTEYYCRTTGEWFGGCWSPYLPFGAMHPEKAAGIRIAKYQYEKYQHLPYWFIPASIAVGSLLAMGFSLAYGVYVFAVMAGALLVVGVAALFVGPERRKKGYARMLADLERFERQRNYPYPPSGP